MINVDSAAFHFVTNAEQPTLQSRSRVTTLTILLTLLINIYLVVSSDAEVSVERQVAGTLALWLALPPTIAYIRRPRFTLIFGPCMMIAYAIYFTRSIFRSDYAVKGVYFTETQLTDAAWVVVLGTIGLSAAFLLSGSKNVVRMLPRLEWTIDPSHALGRLSMFSLLAPTIRLLLRVGGRANIPAGIWQPATLLQELAECAGLVVLCATFMRRDRWSWHAWLVVLGYILSAAICFGGSLIAEPAMVLVIPAFAYVGIRRRIPVITLATGALIIGSALYVKHDYRMAFSGRGYDLGSSARFVEFAYDNISSRGVVADELAESSEGRVNMFGLLAQVVAKSPGEVPLWNGETYAHVLVAPIPRFVWPDKPAISTGQDFGHRYGILDADDLESAANLAQLIEVRANFGTEWMVLGMFALGMIQVAIWRLLDNTKSGPVLLAIGAMVLCSLFLLESSFSGVVGQVLTQIPFLVFGTWLLVGGGWRSLPRIGLGRSG